MAGNGRVFISHVHEDNARVAPLLAALDAWGVDYWFDTQQLGAGQHISERVQQALAERDIFMLICTPATNASMWTGLELQAFRGLLERDKQAGRGERRKVIYLILDPAYARQPVEPHDVVVDASQAHPSVWFKELRSALGVKPPRRGLSRRAVIAAGATATVALAASAFAGVRLLSAQGSGKPVVTPKTHAPTSTPQPEAARLKWFFTSVYGPEALAVANDVVYLSGTEGVYALTAATGDLKWFKSKITGAANSIPQIAGPTMYYCGENEFLLAVSTADGSQVWSAPIGAGSSSTPFVDASGIYANASDGFVYAVNAADGSPRWKTQIGGKEFLDLSSPTASASFIYIGSDDGNVYALSKATGALIWKHQTGGKIQSSPAFANGVVYIGSADQNIYALDALSGAQRWMVRTGYEVNASPIVANGIVYSGSGDANMYALNATTGAVLWKAGTGDLDADGNSTGFGDLIDGRAVLDNGVLYFTAGKYVYALNVADGKRLWRYQTASFILDRYPAVANGVLYFGGDSVDRSIYALKLG
ncbi:MAG TPA: PQQ-binding-like beta-propeller repeat protein [Ktedonobacterales bacterium]|jgi:outer membrane protein assembly factor BamB